MKYDVNVRNRENMIAPVNIFLNKKRLYNIGPFSIGCDESYSLINLRVNVPSEVMTVKVYRPLTHSFNPLMVKGECFSAR